MSRNPKRLELYYNMIRQAHEYKAPDLRIGQLFKDFEASIGDVFYMEDDEFVARLAEWLSQITINDGK